MENYENEIWKQCVNYESLEVSNYGRVRKKARQGIMKWIPAKVLKLKKKSGMLNCSFGGKHYQLNVPELVADAFLPLPNGVIRSLLTAIEIGEKFDFSVDNLQWVLKSLVNPTTRTLYENMKSKQHEKINLEATYKKDENAIVQLRMNGDYVRRYVDINEILDVHVLWNRTDILMCLTGHFPDAYGWKWMYEYIYDKN